MFEPHELNQAIRELLDLNLISMEWDPESEDFVFFMTDEQKERYDEDETFQEEL